MFTKDALEVLTKTESIKAAIEALMTTDDTNSVVALPDDFTLHDVEKYDTQRRRARGTMTTSVITDFASYTNLHALPGAMVFIDPKTMSAKAVLNLGDTMQPGHADNVAKLSPEPTAAYKAMCAIANGQPQKQAAVAEFMEDWSDQVQARNGDEPITLAQAIAAVRKITIEGLRKLETTEESLSASKSTFESVKATSGTNPLPTHLHVYALPFADFAARTFVLRLGVLTSGDKPTLTLRVVNVELHVEEMARELAEMTAKALGEAVPAVIGTYARGE